MRREKIRISTWCGDGVNCIALTVPLTVHFSVSTLSAIQWTEFFITHLYTNTQAKADEIGRAISLPSIKAGKKKLVKNKI